MELTESVRSFQVPATPGTMAWPPSLPSVPTSRATRVTSEAKERSWSTIMFMASLSWRISPRESTVIFLERSPLATAMVTSAMLRTWSVRLEAIELTESVSSRQTPVTPSTCAWPPSLPEVPTSRATRVTSEVNTESCSIILLTSLAERRNSPSRRRPSTSSSIGWPRSPLATAPIVRVTSVVGHARSAMRVLMDWISSAQPPATPGTDMRCWSRPSLPTMRQTRAASRARRSLVRSRSLKASAILPWMPIPPRGQALGEVTISEGQHSQEDLLQGIAGCAPWLAVARAFRAPGRWHNGGQLRGREGDGRGTSGGICRAIQGAHIDQNGR